MYRLQSPSHRLQLFIKILTVFHTLDDFQTFLKIQQPRILLVAEFLSSKIPVLTMCVNVHFVAISYPHKFNHWFQSNYYNGS